jgi:competence protein ComEA
MKLLKFTNRHARMIAVLGCGIFFAVPVLSQGVNAQANGGAQNAGTSGPNSQPPSQPASQSSPSSASQGSQSPAAQSSPSTSQNSLEAEFPNGQGKQTFLTTCSKCHSPENVIGHGQDADGWTNTVLQMIQNGAQGTNEQFGAIVYYLSKHFGPPPATVDINTATAMDLRNWLYFTQKQADAIVAYRKQHGDFQSIDDLKKVPGIDPKMIDADKAKLTFAPASSSPTQQGG